MGCQSSVDRKNLKQPSLMKNTSVPLERDIHMNQIFIANNNKLISSIDSQIKTICKTSHRITGNGALSKSKAISNLKRHADELKEENRSMSSYNDVLHQHTLTLSSHTSN